MSININIKQKFVVNGKEYGSVDEMPTTIREIYTKAMCNANAAHVGRHQTLSAGITFNGQEYTNSAAMPTDMRKIYEDVMTSATCKEGSFRQNGGVQIDCPVRSKIEDPAAMPVRIRPVDAEPLLTPRRLLIVAGGLALLLVFHLIIRS